MVDMWFKSKREDFRIHVRQAKEYYACTLGKVDWYIH